MTASVRRIARPESLRSQIHDDLRRRLQSLEFTQEDRLVDTEVARAYGTSRMPAREALMLLANEGFLRRTSRGFVLPQLAPADIRDIFEVRRLLEPDAAAASAAAMTPARIAQLDVWRGRVAAAADARALMVASAEFRAAWIDALPNRWLREAIEGFSHQVQSVRLVTLRDAGVHATVAAGTDRLHAAFATRDGAAARAAMLDFIGAAEVEYARAPSAPS